MTGVVGVSLSNKYRRIWPNADTAIFVLRNVCKLTEPLCKLTEASRQHCLLRLSNCSAIRWFKHRNSRLWDFTMYYDKTYRVSKWTTVSCYWLYETNPLKVKIKMAYMWINITMYAEVAHISKRQGWFLYISQVTSVLIVIFVILSGFPGGR